MIKNTRNDHSYFSPNFDIIFLYSINFPFISCIMKREYINGGRMTVKKLGVLLTIVISVVTIILGHLHWKEKISAHAKQAVPSAKEQKSETDTTQEAEKKGKLKYAKNLPEEIQEKIAASIETGTPLQFVMFGSEATSSSPSGWPAILKEKLLNTYGEDIFRVSVVEIPGKTSSDIVNEKLYEDVVNLKPDILLFEPFTLKDNGAVDLDTRFENITTMIHAIKEQVPDVVILLQPPHPLYNAVYYPKDVEELKNFAEENGWIFLDHWQVWPDQKSEEIKEFLSPDRKTPSEKGHQIWAKYLMDYFVSE
jgi:hypothetical protein